MDEWRKLCVMGVEMVGEGEDDVDGEDEEEEAAKRDGVFF